MTVRCGLMIAVSLSAVFMDFLMEKVKTELILTGLAAAIVCRLLEEGVYGGISFGAGVMIPILLLFPLFYFRMIGAGDIKLLSVLGGISGIRGSLMIMGSSLALGAVLSLAFLISCGSLQERISYFISYTKDTVLTGEKKPYLKKGKNPENVHFTVPVFLGTMMYLGGILL